jgi:hypothetical protein
MERLPKQNDYSGLGKYIEPFLGRWVVEYAVSIHKFLRDKNLPKEDFKKFAKKIFRISYLKKWRWKYLIAIKFPILFELLVTIKGKFAKAS